MALTTGRDQHPLHASATSDSRTPPADDQDRGKDERIERDGAQPDRDKRDKEDDAVDEASEESFPASDPPSFSPLHAGL